ncbi:hypothetical protein [Pseudomonas sp. GZD-222]
MTRSKRDDKRPTPDPVEDNALLFAKYRNQLKQPTKLAAAALLKKVTTH